MSERIVIAGGPRTGKTTRSTELAAQLGCTAHHTDDTIGAGWSDASAAAADWFDRAAPWIVEGVTAVRALRKWMAANEGRPCDRVIWLVEPFVELSRHQAAMAKGCSTIWDDVEAELVGRGVVIERGGFGHERSDSATDGHKNASSVHVP